MFRKECNLRFSPENRSMVVRGRWIFQHGYFANSYFKNTLERARKE